MSLSAIDRRTISLFTGAGGLDIGLEAAGFEPSVCVEIDRDSRATLEQNRPNWVLSSPGDIHEISPKQLLRDASLRPRQLALLVGGPPCQPFSKSTFWTNGEALRLRDPRSRTLDAFFDVAEAALPHVVLLENVRGIAFNGKSEAVSLIERRFRTINRRHRTAYAPQLITLDSADYGVPQARERIFIIAAIDGRKFETPRPTHGAAPDLKPVVTAWDAIGHLDFDTWSDDLDAKGRWAALLPSIPEGKNYLWHTPRNTKAGGEPLFGWRTRYWSFLLKLAKNRPSWTIQADPGPATGPFHWRSRLLSVEEMSRLQTFPRGYEIIGEMRSARRQIGNAVPSAIGELLGWEIRRQLLGHRVRPLSTLVPNRRPGCPPPMRPKPVPHAYYPLRAKHGDHPGTGEGPDARKRRQRRTEP